MELLFSFPGQKWKEMRPVLSPSFTSSKMRSMYVLMSEVAETFTNHFKDKSKSGTVEIEMKDVLTRYGNDVIASIAFGIEVDSLKNEDNEFYVMGKKATDFSGFWKVLKFFGYVLVPKLYEVNILFICLIKKRSVFKKSLFLELYWQDCKLLKIFIFIDFQSQTVHRGRFKVFHGFSG